MHTVKQLIGAKIAANEKAAVWAVKSDAPVLEAIKIMAEKKIGALLVIDKDEMAGIVSERDYARKVILHGKSSHETPVSEIMSTNVISVEPNDTIDKCMELMSQHNIRHLPVLERGKVTGILSVGDLVKAIIANQRQTIQELEGYIMS